MVIVLWVGWGDVFGGGGGRGNSKKIDIFLRRSPYSVVFYPTPHMFC